MAGLAGGGGGGWVEGQGIGNHAAAHNERMILSSNIEFKCMRKDVCTLLTKVSANEILVILPSDIDIYNKSMDSVPCRN